MDLFTILAACMALSGPAQAADVDPETCQSARAEYRTALQSVELAPEERDAISRVAYAEAANQSDSGLAGVIYTILNRLISGQWGTSATAVVDAPGQFEPVGKAGTWKNLPQPSQAQRTRIDTIINLALDGHLPDPTNGALFFQNPVVVAKREAQGSVSKGLTHFGGSTPSAVIQDHSFYASVSQQKGPVQVDVKQRPEAKSWDIYGKAETGELEQSQSWDVFSANPDSVIVGSAKDRK